MCECECECVCKFQVLRCYVSLIEGPTILKLSIPASFPVPCALVVMASLNPKLNNKGKAEAGNNVKAKAVASGVENHVVKGSGDSSHQSAQELHLLSDHTLSPGEGGVNYFRIEGKRGRKKTIQELYLCVSTCPRGTFRGLHTCLDRWIVAE